MAPTTIAWQATEKTVFEASLSGNEIENVVLGDECSPVTNAQNA